MIRFKKTAGILLILALLCTAACALAGGAKSVVDATPISVNQVVSGNITSGTEEDWYVFTTPGNGYVSITFEHDFVDNGQSYWRTFLLNVDSQEYYYGDDYKGTQVTPVTSCKVGLPAGNYYLKIMGKSSYTYSDVTYRVKVNYTAAEDWEKEFNNTIVQSNAIAVNQDYHGSIRNKDDKDYFTFTLPSSGTVQVAFTHDFVDSDKNLWWVQICDINSNSYFFDTPAFVGKTPTTEKTLVLGLPAGTYYLYVTGDWAQEVYTLNVNYTATTGWETEFNNNINEADSYTLGTKIHGVISGQYDYDFNAVDIPEAGEYKLDFTHEYQAPTGGFLSQSKFWNVQILDESNNEVTSWNYEGTNTGSDPHVISLEKGRYYVNVRRYYDGLFVVWSHQPYAFVLDADDTPGIDIKDATIGTIADQIYTGSAIQPEITVTYNGTELVKDTDYTVSYSKNTEVGKATVTVKGIRKYSGEKTANFTIYPRGVKLSSLSAGRKKLTVKWKKGNGIDGYEIQYSKNKSFSGAKTKVIKGAKTVKAELKKLDGKTTYYVRIRTWKKSGGKKYYSAWSAVKSKKTKK